MPKLIQIKFYMFDFGFSKKKNMIDCCVNYNT